MHFFFKLSFCNNFHFQGHSFVVERVICIHACIQRRLLFILIVISIAVYCMCIFVRCCPLLHSFWPLMLFAAFFFIIVLLLTPFILCTSIKKFSCIIFLFILTYFGKSFLLVCISVEELFSFFCFIFIVLMLCRICCLRRLVDVTLLFFFLVIFYISFQSSYFNLA